MNNTENLTQQNGTINPPKANRDGFPTYREVGRGIWLSSLRRQLLELWKDFRNPPSKIKITADIDPAALDKMIGGRLPVVSIHRQLSELIEERLNPPPKVEITAEADPRALDNLIEARSPFTSIFFQLKSIVADIVHPTKIETTAEPVDVREIWSERRLRVPAALAVTLHLLAIALVFFPGWTVENTQVSETFIPLYLPLDLVLNLPQEEDDSGGGGGGGIGGGVFRVGGGVTPPTILFKIDPIYSEAARKARYEGTVVLGAIVRKDGTIDILRVVRSLGFGLDQSAIKALKLWKFRPGMRNGVPVDVSLNIEVNFSLS